MIIGNGLIAQACAQHFGDDPNVIVFASGVSNSRENSSDAFLRERQMLGDAMSCQEMVCRGDSLSTHNSLIVAGMGAVLGSAVGFAVSQARSAASSWPATPDAEALSRACVA